MSNGPVFNLGTIFLNQSQIKEDFGQKAQQAQFALDNQVIKDSNYYIPLDTGALRDSAILASKVGKGSVVWNTKYARKLYYNPQFNFAQDKNPNARGLWFEAAKAQKKAEWVKIVEQIIKGLNK